MLGVDHQKKKKKQNKKKKKRKKKKQKKKKRKKKRSIFCASKIPNCHIPSNLKISIFLVFKSKIP
jgi:hypothetical protein